MCFVIYHSLQLLTTASERKKAGIVGERLHIVHRLDRLTSGLSLFAKDVDVAVYIYAQVHTHIYVHTST
jgi:23S rRNA-/tRNA-specific pseudouridylate synthase